MPIQYDSNGIITQNLTEILDERETALQEVMGEEFVIDKTTPIGNMELADANNELAIQELIAYLIPNMIDAKTAKGFFLDAICEKNRIYRKQAQYTTLNLKIIGTKNTEFISGDITVSDSLTGVYYTLNEDVMLPENGELLAQFKCEYIGTYYPSNNAIFNILTPMVGLNSVEMDSENANIVLGRLTETDEELRRRREMSVAQTSINTLGSIKSNLYSLDGMLHVTYFENDTEETDNNGLPMKSFEFITDGGDEQEIAQTIFNNKPAGTRAYGTTKINIEDSEGVPHQIGFTKAEIINTGIEIKLSTYSPQSNTWKTTVAQALKEKFDLIQDIGTTVKDYNYYTVLTTYPEISDIESIQFYDIDEPEEKTNQLVIDKKAIAKLDVNNISIVTE